LFLDKKYWQSYKSP